MPSYNIVQTIYTMDSFAVLRDKVSAYFTNRGFLLGDGPEDKLTDRPLIERWVSGDCVGPARCHAILYASRLHYNEIGGGTLVVVNNNRSSNSESPIPDTAAKFFGGLPNSVSLDAHQYWSRESNGLAAELAMFLSKRGHHSIMLSFDDRVTAIKSNPYLSIDERLVELAATVEGYLPVPVAFPVLEAALRQQAGDCIWNELSPNARNYLRTGCIGFDQLDGASRVVLEASPGVISLSKALEDTVIRRLMTPFRHFVAVSGGSLPAVADKRLDKLRDYARNESCKPLELGTFASQLAHLDTPDTSALPPTAVVYMQFLSTLSEPEYLQRRLSSELLNATRNFRNRAAHPDPVTFQQLHEYLVYLLGEGDEKGLLARLISASRPLADATNPPNAALTS